LMVLFSCLGMAISSSAQESMAREGCLSCDLQINSLDKPLPLGGGWLFTREDSPTNADPATDTTDWKVVRAPGPWKKAYGDGKNFRVGWYRGQFTFDKSLIGTEVVLSRTNACDSSAEARTLRPMFG
jgi:hypothetical protein